MLGKGTTLLKLACMFRIHPIFCVGTMRCYFQEVIVLTAFACGRFRNSWLRRYVYYIRDMMCTVVV